MLLDSYIYGNGTYDFLSCKRHHQIFALFIILLQRKKLVFLYARKKQKKYHNPHSEAEKLLLGALGTFGKYVNPVISSRSLTLIISLLLTFWPLSEFVWARTNAAHLSSDALQSFKALPVLPLFVRSSR